MEKRYKKGHFIGLGIAIGLPVGIPIGLILGNIIYGPVLGIIIGLIIGIVMEKKKNPNPILTSVDEKKKQKTLSWFLVGLGMVTISMVTFIYINHQ